MANLDNEREIDAVLRDCPCLAELNIAEANLEISDYESFRKQSLLENFSSAAGHPREAKSLYVIQEGCLKPIEVNRVARAIYPPSYYGEEYPADEYGWSESVEEALNRVNLAGVPYVVLDYSGCNYDNPWNDYKHYSFRKIIVAKVDVGERSDASAQHQVTPSSSILFCPFSASFNRHPKSWDYAEHLRSAGWRVVTAEAESALRVLQAGCKFEIAIFDLYDSGLESEGDVHFKLAYVGRIRERLSDAIMIGLTKFPNKILQKWFISDGDAVLLQPFPTPSDLQERLEALIHDKTTRVELSTEPTAIKMQLRRKIVLQGEADAPTKEQSNLKIQGTVTGFDPPVVTSPFTELSQTLRPPTRSSNSERRSRTVAQLIHELNVLKPQIFGHSDYEGLATEHSEFLVFRICKDHKDLRERVLYDAFSRRNIRLAHDLAARLHGVKLSTIQTDWKKGKPAEFRHQSRGKK